MTPGSVIAIAGKLWGKVLKNGRDQF